MKALKYDKAEIFINGEQYEGVRFVFIEPQVVERAPFEDVELFDGNATYSCNLDVDRRSFERFSIGLADGLLSTRAARQLQLWREDGVVIRRGRMQSGRRYFAFDRRSYVGRLWQQMPARARAAVLRTP
jgi:hypothetical protein